VAGEVIPLSDKIKILGATLILRLCQVPAFTTFVLSGKFIHRWMIAVSLLHLHSFLCAWISQTLSCTALHSKTQLAFNESSGQARVVLYQYSCVSPLSSNELLKQLHWLPIERRIRFKLATLTFKA